MEQADRCRRAAVEAVADVEPPRLHDFIESTLEGASMVPGVLALESATAVAPDAAAVLDDEYDIRADGCDTDIDAERGPADTHVTVNGMLAHAAGVQLIYEGLRLTRSLAHEEPWTDAGATSDGDLEILAADILVARGFHLLARTDAAGKAVRTVQAFGRDQTRRTEAASNGDAPDDIIDSTTVDANLEHDVLELAVLAGTAAVDETPPAHLLETADEIAATVGTSFPPASQCLSDSNSGSSSGSGSGAESTPRDHSLEESVTDRITSATDP